jgi:FADH2 O2-dependent halogenase
MWMLRFNNGLVSAGLVLDARRHPLDPTESPQEEWAVRLRRYPSLQEQFATARLVDPPGALIRTGRLQRRLARAAGRAWASLPHTAGFIDPLHSTGIAHSLSGVERLAGLLARHWGTPGLETALYAYEDALFRELALLDRLVAACYASLGSFRLFTASTMLYFAATLTYERERAGRSRTPAPPERLFLCADDEGLNTILDEALARLSALDGSPSPDKIAAFEQFVEAAIHPYNTAGLFHPPRPNMYHHTAAPIRAS